MLFKGSKGVHLRPIKFGGLFIVAERERASEHGMLRQTKR